MSSTPSVTKQRKPTVNPKAALIVAAFAAFLATFNETFLNVGFAPIMADLNVDVSTTVTVRASSCRSASRAPRFFR